MFVLSFLVRIETKQRVAVVIVGQNRKKAVTFMMWHGSNKERVVVFKLRYCIVIVGQRKQTAHTFLS